MNTFSSFSFGCRVNQAEKEALDARLLSLGFEAKSASPDFHIINTCAVTGKAEREARQYIYRYRRHHPQTRIILAGCSATYWLKNGLYRNLPVDAVIPNSEKDSLPDILKTISRPDMPASLYQKLPEDKFLSSGRAMVKIQDGCHRFCSYCIVPYLRGLPKSVKIVEIVKTVTELEKKGIKETILTAINTEAFGKDSGENIVALIKSLLANTAIERISFGSIHPWSLTDEFLDYYESIKNNPRFVHFFHIPLQSGCDKILKLMKRDYGIKEIGEKLKILAQINPNALIATDIIAGYLGESDEDFRKTCDFLVKSPISRFHVFPYSVRKNTAAYFLARQTPDLPLKVKKQRTRELISIGGRKLESFMQKQMSRKTAVLFLKEKKNGCLTALADNQLNVVVSGNISLPGSLGSVKITGTGRNGLVGEIC